MNLRLLIAEGRKLKVISIFLPVISGMLLLAITVAQWYYHFHRDSDDVYILFNVLYMLLPFSIFLTGTILTSITVGTEHESQGWKQILTLPFPRVQIYFAKFIWLLILMLIQGMVHLSWDYPDLDFAYFLTIAPIFSDKTDFLQHPSLYAGLDHPVFFVDSFGKSSNPDCLRDIRCDC